MSKHNRRRRERNRQAKWAPGVPPTREMADDLDLANDMADWMGIPRSQRVLLTNAELASQLIPTLVRLYRAGIMSGVRAGDLTLYWQVWGSTECGGSVIAWFAPPQSLSHKPSHAAL